MADNGERMAEDSKTNKDLAEEYKSQSMGSAMRVNYKGPSSRPESWESQAHTGGPMCYPCCGPKCALSLVAIVVVLIVCCAYVSQDKTCCSICYWPF